MKSTSAYLGELRALFRVDRLRVMSHLLLLPLVDNLDRLPFRTQNHSSRALLRTDSPSLRLILHERYALPSRYQPHLLEAIEPLEKYRKTLNAVLVRQVLHKQNLVRRQVLLGYDSPSGGIRGLESSAAGRLDRPDPDRVWCRCRSLQPLGRLSCFRCLLSLCGKTPPLDSDIFRERPFRLTFLGQPPSLMHFEILLGPFLLHGGIAPGLRVVEHHRLLKQLESLNILYGSFRGLHFVEHHECLPLGLEVLLRDEIDDGTVFGEDSGQGFFELIQPDALF